MSSIEHDKAEPQEEPRLKLLELYLTKTELWILEGAIDLSITREFPGRTLHGHKIDRRTRQLLLDKFRAAMTR